MSKGNNPAHKAAYLGDIDKIQELINSNSPYLNTPNDLGILPISIADRKGHREIAKLLFPHTNLTLVDNYSNNLIHLGAKYPTAIENILERNANLPENERLDINAKAYNGNTAMHIATYFNNLEAVKSLLKYNASIILLNNDDETPIALSIDNKERDNNNLEIMSIFASIVPNIIIEDKFMSHENPIPENRELFQAAYDNDITFLNTSNLVNSTDIKQALNIAAFRGNLEFATKLLELGARADLGDSVISSLHIASKQGDIEMIELLIPYIQDINIRDQIDGNTPLHLIIEETKLDVDKKIEIINLLIINGAKLDLKNNYELSPRDIAKFNHIEVILDLNTSTEEASSSTFTPEAKNTLAFGALVTIPSVVTPLINLINNKKSIESEKVDDYEFLELSNLCYLIAICIAMIGLVVYNKPNNANYSNEPDTEPLGEGPDNA